MDSAFFVLYVLYVLYYVFMTEIIKVLNPLFVIIYTFFTITEQYCLLSILNKLETRSEGFQLGQMCHVSYIPEKNSVKNVTEF